jgi:hypothetical protein
MCTWKTTLCAGKNGACQTEIERIRVIDCGEHHADDADETTWQVERSGTCQSCAYPSPPDSDG